MTETKAPRYREQLERRRTKLGEGSLAGSVAAFLILAGSSQLNFAQEIAVACFGLAIPLGVLYLFITWDNERRESPNDNFVVYIIISSAVFTLLGFGSMFFGLARWLGIIFTTVSLVCVLFLGLMIEKRDKQTSPSDPDLPTK